MIIKKTFLLSILALESIMAQRIVDCRVLISGVNKCNPYSTRFYYVGYEEDKQIFYSNKNLVMPIEKNLKNIISSKEILDRYTKRTKALYFEETDKVKRLIVFPPKQIPYGYYTVVSGDVLGKIAKQFKLTLSTLVKLNSLKNKASIKIGQKIKLPMAQNDINHIVTGTYIIVEGDTVLSIAKKFNFSVKVLVEYNNIETLKVGQVLKLPFAYILAKIKTKAKREAEIKQLRLHGYGTHKLRVTATAYTSHKNQTDSTPFLAAWNNRIRPGMKMIAVSRDLLRRSGIKNGAKVKISGLSGFYRVKDKMNKRYRKRIDIYMGLNKRKALKWGRRSVVIYW